MEGDREWGGGGFEGGREVGEAGGITPVAIDALGRLYCCIYVDEEICFLF